MPKPEKEEGTQEMERHPGAASPAPSEAAGIAGNTLPARDGKFDQDGNFDLLGTIEQLIEQGDPEKQPQAA